MVRTASADSPTFSVVHAFTNAPDGPGGVLITGSDGFLYGTTRGGGLDGSGTVFKVEKSGTGFTVLHNFTSLAQDGRSPSGRLLDIAGVLFGTTEQDSDGVHSGVIF